MKTNMTTVAVPVSGKAAESKQAVQAALEKTVKTLDKIDPDLCGGTVKGLVEGLSLWAYILGTVLLAGLADKLL